jgi:hypothetical protein
MAYRNKGSAMNPHQSTITRLQEKRATKVDEQRLLAAKMHSQLTDKSGLIANNARKCRNLQVAIAKSKAPGTFAYHISPASIRKAEKDNAFGSMNNTLNSIQKEIHQIDRDLTLAQRKKQQMDDSQQKVGILNMSQWFDTFGVPKPEPAPGYCTKFTPGTKVYGGTNHYAGFRTRSTRLMKGRMTS